VKKKLLILQIILGIGFTTSMVSCTKGIKEPVTLDNAAGTWYIHAIRYQIYDGTQTPQDSTVPWNPAPRNFVNFDGISKLQYCFNSPNATSGSYSFIGDDSIRITVGNEDARWKILLLTPTNFNIERTSTDNHTFPGALVVKYQSFVR
jgi:hypothetical protein